MTRPAPRHDAALTSTSTTPTVLATCLDCNWGGRYATYAEAEKAAERHRDEMESR